MKIGYVYCFDSFCARIIQDDKYSLSPAYDLVPVLMVFPQDEMALSLNGKKKNLTKNDFFKFGLYMGIDKKVILNINNSIYKKKDEMISFIDNSILNSEEKNKFKNFILNRVEELFS